MSHRSTPRPVSEERASPPASPARPRIAGVASVRRALAALALFACACSIAPAPDGADASPGADALPPPGYGTLRQEEISISLRSRDLEVMVTPLAESVIRVTAPDTYDRLSRIADTRGPQAPAASKLFLVSFYTQQPEVRFVPEEVQLLSRGLRLRPLQIIPITPSWGQRRVQQRRTEMAVYAFPGDVDLESDLVLAYGLEQTDSWSTTLSRIQAERARARARAGIGVRARNPAQARVGGGQASRSYFEIFR